MPTLVASSSIATQYEISNSLRFNDGDSAKLSRTPSSAGNRQTWTISVWVKRSTLTTGQGIFSTYSGNANINTQSAFQSNDKLNFYDATSAYQWRFVTNQLFRDPSAWYNLCYVSDTTQSTAGDRIKLYINGSRVTSFEVALNPDQNNNTADWNADVLHNIGEHNGEFFDGYMAEFHNIDGQALTPSDFGETDDNGVWIPKAYTGSYGTNGFYLEFKKTGTGTDANGIGADTSGNDNHFAVTNLAATDVTTDTPTNNFATLNPLDGGQAAVTLEEGNTLLNMGSWSSWGYTASTFYPTSGKWYLETKLSSTSAWFIGVVEDDNTAFYNLAAAYPTSSNGGYALYSDGRKAVAGSGLATYTVDCRTAGAIIGMAIDLDNNRLYFSKNNGWSDGDGSADASTPNAYLTLPANKTFRLIWSSDGVDFSVNFGNPPYANSSSASDANSYGDFEYAPPSGYYSLCTKNLAEFG